MTPNEKDAWYGLVLMVAVMLFGLAMGIIAGWAIWG